MIEVIAGHSVDTYLLPQFPSILDLGCRDFSFTDYFPVYINKYSIDIDKLDTTKSYYRLAISNGTGTCGLEGEGEATKIGKGNSILMTTLPLFSKMVGVEKWDLIKMDIEGEEMNILPNLKHPYAKQISVEFHAHCGYSKADIDSLLDELSEWYEIHNRVWEERHHAGFNYWDVLLIERRFEYSEPTNY